MDEIEFLFGKNLKKIRAKKHITQDALAAQLQTIGCDLTRSAIAKIEVGERHVYVNEIVYIKQALKVSFEELFNIE